MTPQENKPNQPAGEKICEITKVTLLEIFKRVSLLDLSSCQFEYGDWDDNDGTWINAEHNGRVVDSIKHDGNIFWMMNNDDSFSPLNPMKAAFDLLYPTPSSPIDVEQEAKGLRPPDREGTRIDIVHNGMHISKDYPGHAFAILFAEYLAEHNYEHDYNSHNSGTTSWNEIDDPQLHGEDGPEVLTTNQVFIKFEKWVAERYNKLPFLAGWEARQRDAVELTNFINDNFYTKGQCGEDGEPLTVEQIVKDFLTSKNK